MKWYAFIPVIGYGIWYKEAKNVTQLTIVFIYQMLLCVSIMFLALIF